MRQPEQVIFANLCLIQDKEGHILMQDRVGPIWPGLALPGGHWEKGESFADSVIREIWEETGLTIEHPRLCGIKHWEEDGIQQMVFLYKADQYSGQLTSSEEGAMSWVSPSDLPRLKLAKGMMATLRPFLEEDVTEMGFQLQGDGWEPYFR